jgi:hypothetical protein
MIEENAFESSLRSLLHPLGTNISVVDTQRTEVEIEMEVGMEVADKIKVLIGIEGQKIKQEHSKSKEFEGAVERLLKMLNH